MFLFRFIRRIITIVVVLALIAPAYGVSQVWRAAKNPVVRQADVIVVLGTAQLNGKPGDALEARLIEAKRIYDLGYASSIITVGAGAPGDRTTEAASSKYWLRMNSVRPARFAGSSKNRSWSNAL